MKTIDHYYSYRTYSGCLEGYPPLDLAYKSIRSQVKKLWGDRPVHIIEPEIKVIPKNGHFGPHNVLPSWTHIVWANGPEKDPENHGSQLVVVWFSNEPIAKAENVLEQVDWAAHAEDFQY